MRESRQRSDRGTGGTAPLPTLPERMGDCCGVTIREAVPHRAVMWELKDAK